MRERFIQALAFNGDVLEAPLELKSRSGYLKTDPTRKPICAHEAFGRKQGRTSW